MFTTNLRLKAFFFILSAVAIGIVQQLGWGQATSVPAMTKLIDGVYQHYYGFFRN